MKRFSLLLLAAVLLCASCRKDSESTDVNISYPDPEVWVNTSILGVVVDEDENPLENAKVSVHQLDLLTDDNGVFYFKDIQANQSGAVIKVELAGYFTTSTTIYPQLNSVSSVKIKLLTSDIGGLVQAPTGGEVPLGNGASVTFPENAFELNDVAYTGQVTVKGVWLDPTAEDLFEKMPGNLLGIDNQNRLRGMATYGMVGVELYDPVGREVELADGKMATVKFPLPDAIRAEAPSEIPLWHYDVERGFWFEEGTAVKEGDYYVGQVAHFSFWNCDDPFETVVLSGTVVNESGLPYSNLRVTLKRNTSTNNTGYAITDSRGYYSGKIPKDEILTMTLEDACGDEVLTKTIGPFGADHTLPDETINTPGDFSVRGRLIDCNSNPVTNGYVMILMEGVQHNLTPSSNGTFSGLVSYCGGSPEIAVLGKNLDSYEQGDTRVFTFVNPLDVGDIIACGDIIPHLKFVVDGLERVVEPCYGTMTQDSLPNGNLTDATWLQAEDPRYGYYYLVFDDITTGTHDVIQIYGNGNVSYSEIMMTTEVTTYGQNKGEYIIGTFSGTAVDQSNGNTVTITGEYVAERQ